MTSPMTKGLTPVLTTKVRIPGLATKVRTHLDIWIIRPRVL